MRMKINVLYAVPLPIESLFNNHTLMMSPDILDCVLFICRS